MTNQRRQLDLRPAARTVTTLLDGVDDRLLRAPTPCEATDVRRLLHHFLDLTLAFRDAARKETGPLTDSPPAHPAERHEVLGEDWRGRLAQQLDALAEAWRDPPAWQGETRVGGVTLPGAVAGRIALNELVLHG